ncbi:MAG: hypothetical protein A2W61_01765 [Deltaproteobacteria bacterium RIFCSPLOWO2_01_44_7]|nr:MAG: hypothetical protein A2712_00785 [Deltaproteobacteria bacterium RIFCSPHIGHO2_01_FULL_43_49]OGQ14190.1 MAG: hypothetical protein A3D22_09825 [Deltaproteobacteria bacterium RIFCSPHIGHO2_02_FULL_44_53]OGQ27406.1 MAG: hypothetical protein A3D98_03425 [Deltaproteobacteria bacterium RIFCSPHIGHO2_12_FULL_44_21]OGQ30654.1 MAG: hypothetical protein A2979_05850 [Deltaproteobacteria bacterium RIFCSPLOWO2_01_FULL_45_74]OGQ38770.1 MAG: hypothetical protein A2W61_01765 [Deltaproteobacteria bacterium 
MITGMLTPLETALFSNPALFERSVLEGAPIIGEDVEAVFSVYQVLADQGRVAPKSDFRVHVVLKTAKEKSDQVFRDRLAFVGGTYLMTHPKLVGVDYFREVGEVAGQRFILTKKIGPLNFSRFALRPPT